MPAARTGLLAALALTTFAVTAAAPPPVEPASDADLLRAMHDDYVGLTGERGRARTLLGELNAERYDENLAARASSKDGADPRAASARKELIETWQRLFFVVSGPQPVDPRLACRSQERSLRDALAGPPGSAAEARLPQARAQARACQARLAGSLEATRTARVALEAALAQAKGLLAAPPTPKGGAPTAAPPGPSPARQGP